MITVRATGPQLPVNNLRTDRRCPAPLSKNEFFSLRKKEYESFNLSFITPVRSG
ncbi:MAG: hypothetical protein WB014_04560 [Methanosarcina sp.]